MVGEDFDKASISTAERQKNSQSLRGILGSSPELVDTKQALRIIEAGIDPDMTFKGGDTLLIHAGFAGNSTVICALLENGANPNLANERKETPLHYAAKAMLPKAVAALLQYGADVYASDEFGKNAEAHAESVPQSGDTTMAHARYNVLKLLRHGAEQRIQRDMNAALLREEMQNFTTTGCATTAEVKPMKRLQIKTPGSDS
ncbi:MAG: ankyrin repeat domain-containing protein [Alphaproteobacteria bacterium]